MRRLSGYSVARRRLPKVVVTPPVSDVPSDEYDPTLPQWTAPSSLTAPPTTTGTIYECDTISEVYAALADIKANQTWGNEVRLTANVVFADSGTIVLPAVAGHEDGMWNKIVSSAVASLPTLPASGVAADGGDLSIRVNPTDHATFMPTLRQNAVNQRRLAVERNGKGWYIHGIRFDMDPALNGTNYALVHLGPGSLTDSDFGPYTTATLPAELPSHIVMQQCIVHTDYPNTCYKNIRIDATQWAILNSHTYGQGRDSGDANAIWIFLGEGKGLVDNTFVCHNGEQLLVGGSDITAAHWLGILPCDVTFSRCHFWKDPRWFVRHPRFDSAKYGSNVGIKNICELKFGERFHFVDCELYGCTAQGQNGQAFHFKSMNQSGGQDWARTRDVYIENCRVRRCGSGIEFISMQVSDGGSGAAPGSRMKARNVFVDVSEVLNPSTGLDIYSGAKEGIRFYCFDSAPALVHAEYPITHAMRCDHATFRGVNAKGWSIVSGLSVASDPTLLKQSYIQNSIFGSAYTGDKYDGSTYSDSGRFHETAVSRHFSLADGDHFRSNVLSRRLSTDYDGTTEANYTGSSDAVIGLNSDGTLASDSPCKAGGSYEALDGTDNGVNWSELNAALSGVIQVNDTIGYADHEDLS